MALVCPSCDQEPPADAKAGGTCAACGSRLVIVGAPDALIGTVIDGRFEILDRLGSGAMGVVYRAKQLSIGREVAIKVMNAMDDAVAVKRFFREAKIASSLSHPNTVQLIEFGQHGDGRVYIAMELVRGHTLYDELTKSALPSRRICRIGTQLCDALEAAHKLGIVHRDLKPENVMIADDGSDHVKILDFGIARILGDSRDRLTNVGHVAGTPNYMAPEVLGSAAEPAPPQDMYALGVILAELSLGRSLFPGTTLEALFVAKLENTAFDEVPPRLRPLVKRLVDKSPEVRPTAADARRMLRELDRAATDPAGMAATAAGLPALSSLDVVALDRHGQTDLETPVEKLAGGPPALELEPAHSTQAEALDLFAPPPVAPAPPLETESKGGGLDIMTPAALAKEPLLDVEKDWQRERSNKQATSRSAKPAPTRASGATSARRSSVPVLPVLVLLALAGGGVYLVMQRSNDSTPSAPAKRTTPPAPSGQPGTTPRPHRPAPPTEPELVTPPENTPPKTGVTIRIVGAPGTAITIDGANAGKTPISLSRKASKRALVIGAKGSLIRVIPDRDQTIDITNPP